jgi:hypothetical protein
MTGTSFLWFWWFDKRKRNRQDVPLEGKRLRKQTTIGRLHFLALEPLRESEVFVSTSGNRGYLLCRI